MITSEFEIYHYRGIYFKPLDFHNHDFYEVYFFLDGSVTYYIEDQVYELEPGQLLVIPPGRMHWPVIFDSSAYERMVLWINVDYLHSLENHTELLTQKLNLFNGTNGYLIHLKEESFSFLLGIFNRLISLGQKQVSAGAFSAKIFYLCFVGGNMRKTKRTAKFPRFAKETSACSRCHPVY